MINQCFYKHIKSVKKYVNLVLPVVIPIVYMQTPSFVEPRKSQVRWPAFSGPNSANIGVPKIADLVSISMVHSVPTSRTFGNNWKVTSYESYDLVAFANHANMIVFSPCSSALSHYQLSFY